MISAKDEHTCINRWINKVTDPTVYLTKLLVFRTFKETVHLLCLKVRKKFIILTILSL